MVFDVFRVRVLVGRYKGEFVFFVLFDFWV